MPHLTRVLAPARQATLGVLLLVSPVLSGHVSLGVGSDALLGGDLTDPQDDANDGAGAGFDWLEVDASSELYFHNEGALNIFDNRVGSGDDKWCCETAPQWISVKLDLPHILTHFTLSAGNDAPERDPTRWMIEGSADGSHWNVIFHWDTGESPFNNRLEVIRFNGGGSDFAEPPPYQWFRYRVTAVDGSMHQVNELELFGIPVRAIEEFGADRSLVPPGQPVTLSWSVDPAVTSVVIEPGIGDVTDRTVGGKGQITLDPGPTATTLYQLTAVHPDYTEQADLTVSVTDLPIIESFTATPPIIGPGESSTLTWQVLNASSLDIGGTDVTGDPDRVVSPAGGTSYTLSATNASGTLTRTLFLPVVTPGQPVLSEFMASNGGGGLEDEDGDTPDWIELHNPSGTTAQLDGYYLTDDPQQLDKWRFPAVEMASLEYLVVFASGKDRALAGSELHTNFALAAGGEYLALVAPDGQTILSEFGSPTGDYPPQESGISFGYYGDPPSPGYFETATPGSANSDGFEGFVGAPGFSVSRGFRSAPFQLALSTPTPGALIRYTTDGSPPDATHGLPYSGPILVDRTTPLRAVATRPGYRSSGVVTHTYVFPDDVIGQTAAITQSTYGLPADWGGISPDYGMDPRVTSLHQATIRDDLQSVPSLSIVMDTEEMFGPSGIYSNPEGSGVAWERATSVELIDPALPDGTGDFQIDCGIRIQGGAFRSHGLSHKKSFRLLFKGEYGPTKLEFPLFGSGSEDEFDTLVLRMESNDGYQWGNRTNVQYARDQFARRTQLDIGRPAAHGRHLNLYINGVYWGIYNVVERPDASFGAAYFGADKDDWDGINAGDPTNDGRVDSWNALNGLVSGISSAASESARTAAYMRAQGLNPDGSDNPALADFIDIDSYADYLLINWYLGNADWPHRNYYTGRERDLLDPSPSTGARTSDGTHFFCWDSEWTMFLGSNNDPTGSTNGVCQPYGHLRQSLEFRLRLADRAQRALFHEGALTPQACLDRYADVTARHTRILVPELARWGDQHGTLRTIAQWQAEYQHIRSDWLAVRTPALVSILRGAGLFPDVDAPGLSPRGGAVTAATPVRLSSDASRIYYTLDGSDPRLLGGGVSPSATAVDFDGSGPADTPFLDTGSIWKYWDQGSDPGAGWQAAGFADGDWPSGPSSLGYGSDNEGSGTTIGFGPNPSSKYATTYFRTQVTLDDPGDFDHFLLRVKYDDALAFYVNGTAVVLTDNLPDGSASAYDQYATSQVASESAWKDFLVPSSAFVAGINTLAAQVHQVSGTSSDVRFDVKLVGEVGAGGANVSDPIHLSGSTLLRARAFDPATQEWSALDEAFFSIGTVPAGPENLVVSEFNYRPYEPVAANEVLVSTDRDDYEFVELLNVGEQTLDLGGVAFELGVTFVFPEQTELLPGARILVVSNPTAYLARYGSPPAGTVIAGEYAGHLSNDGETLRLTGAGGTIREFTYNDQPPWPEAADGDGPSLVLIAPGSLPDHNVAANWRASTLDGGSPGGVDGRSFDDWAALFGVGGEDEDDDGDGWSNFGEYASGSIPTDPGSFSALAIRMTMAGGDPAVELQARVSLEALDRIRLDIEGSEDMRAWASAADSLDPPGFVVNGDGTITYTWRGDAMPANGAFFRASYESR